MRAIAGYCEAFQRRAGAFQPLCADSRIGQGFRKLKFHAGLEYRLTKMLTVRSDAYIILGWFNGAFSKGRGCFRGSDRSVEAPSVASTARLGIFV